MEDYASLAGFYDDLLGYRNPIVTPYLLELISEHHPEAVTILEIGCGTGNILAEIQKLTNRYTLEGLDISQPMLDVASQKLPDVPWHLGDMRTFNLSKQFDVVLCIFNSINHIVGLDGWEQTFGQAAAHLNSGGIFIFDILPVGRYAYYAAQEPSEKFIGEQNQHRVVTNIKHKAETEFISSFTVYENAEQADETLHEEHFHKASYFVKDIISLLEKHFAEVSLHERQGGEPGEESEPLYFLCRKEA